MIRPKLSSLKPRVKAARISHAAPLERRQHDHDSIERKRFYDSALWQQTREAKLRRDPMCQYCAHEGRLTPGQDVDHYRSLAEGGHPTADENLVTACHPCHSRKTHAEQHGLPIPSFAPSRARAADRGVA
jgi:5-methylcytosine-specific restriction endonuclease McrA